ncbi:aspartyl/glutamyl-tRNA(Asn/Gln) amidotransferase, B subunit [Verruconis gallopava]|uniref:Glutamyl-tRNA(Gln) amidotransferase subunit B, mitochondrial n=1 Tax=Verruconis gallopava TaxID=253628 RepID=A0A0D2AFG5_9PEZI|nr:aspartyl/glutamyl-tRNA(Asn/Gln) amidotransferase, B subunit [Verruconis gallopava]KIW05713.1 aspartyl/glutamyl-tRNA(Asn/Gln) amidotransferase, B subunit [Verruconis gallopava]
MLAKGFSSPVRSFINIRNSGICLFINHPPAYWNIQQRALVRSLATSTSQPNELLIPLRKQLKAEAKQKRERARSGPTAEETDTVSTDGWELTVGIEIHAELNTARKLFSEAPTSSPDAAPNSNVALFDLAYPGSQPHFQIATLLPALRAAIALNCDIQRKSTFDRKHYFYQDQPAGYQITQYYEPFARDGHITLYDYDGIAAEDGEQITIGIKQIQMEQDTAKTIQIPPSEHYLDFNRVSHPLIEIITLPQIHHPTTAAALVRKVQSILKAVNACTTGMELGGLRADVNVSVRRRQAAGEYTGGSYHGVSGLGQRTEIKNLSSFKAVEDAIIAERNRQIKVLESGGVVEGETRGWTLGNTETKKLRGKEGEIDYRYMPDPDIAPVIISKNLVDHLREKLPKLPDELLMLLTKDPAHGLTMKDAKTLLSFDDGDRLDFYFEVLHRVQKELGRLAPYQLGRVVGNWVIHELGALLGRADTPCRNSRVSTVHLAHILVLLQEGKITNASAKQLLSLVFEGDMRDVGRIVEEDGMLVQDIDGAEYSNAARRLIEANPEMVKAIKEKGQHGKVMWFVGQMLREMAKDHGKGSVNAEKAKHAVAQILDVRV